MNEQNEELNLGGNIDTALSGQYELNTGDVIKEAFQLTTKHFLSFSPSIVFFFIIQVAIFVLVINMQVDDIATLLQAINDNAGDPDQVAPYVQILLEAVFIASFSNELISAPIFAGVSLMAMSHSLGIKTTFHNLFKGFRFALPIMLMTLAVLTLLFVSSIISNYIPIPIVSLLLSFYISVTLSNSVLLICDKRLPLYQALLLSFRAVNKKLLPVVTIYIFIFVLFVAATFLYGIGLIFVIPFYLHAKGIIYRTMFGVRVKVLNTNQDHPSSHVQSRKFDA